MKLLRVLRQLVAMPPSRRRQWLALQRDRLRTRLVYAARLRRCGAGTIVQKPLFWTPECIELGDHVLIWPNCRIEGITSHGTDVYHPRITLEDEVSFQQGCHVVAATDLLIGAGTTISSGVFISDSDHGYAAIDVNVLKQPLEIQKTSIGSTCLIGAGARILAGTQLGDHCIVGTNAVVRGIFPDHCVLVGIPARVVKRFDAASGTWRKTNAEGQFLI